jgi:hypothetical protein
MRKQTQQQLKLKTLIYDGLDIIQLLVDDHGNYMLVRKPKPSIQYSLDYSNGRIKAKREQV